MGGTFMGVFSRHQRLHLLCAVACLLAFGCAFHFYISSRGETSTSTLLPEEPFSVSVPVLMYHCIIDDKSKVGDYVITPGMFADDMAYLQEQGYQAVSTYDLINYTDLGVPLPEKPVLITFDDGHYNILKYIAPILEEKNYCALVNVEGSFIEAATAEGVHSSEYAYLTWEDINELCQNGNFEIGNHTHNMHTLNGLRRGSQKMSGETDEQYRDALKDDLGHLQDLLEEYCGVSALTFAYPYGLISDESIPILEEMGFRILLTCYEKPNKVSIAPGETLILNRYNRSGKDSTYEYMSRLLSNE